MAGLQPSAVSSEQPCLSQLCVFLQALNSYVLIYSVCPPDCPMVLKLSFPAQSADVGRRKEYVVHPTFQVCP